MTYIVHFEGPDGEDRGTAQADAATPAEARALARRSIKGLRVAKVEACEPPEPSRAEIEDEEAWLIDFYERERARARQRHAANVTPIAAGHKPAA